MKTPQEEQLTKPQDQLKMAKLNIRLYQALCFGFFLFAVFLTIFSEYERREKVLLNGNLIGLEYQIDSFRFVIKCKDAFILELSQWNNLKSGKERKSESRKDKKERIENGIFIK